jgi:hypothetical protein
MTKTDGISLQYFNAKVSPIAAMKIKKVSRDISLYMLARYIASSLAIDSCGSIDIA